MTCQPHGRAHTGLELLSSYHFHPAASTMRRKRIPATTPCSDTALGSKSMWRGVVWGNTLHPFTRQTFLYRRVLGSQGLGCGGGDQIGGLAHPCPFHVPFASMLGLVICHQLFCVGSVPHLLVAALCLALAPAPIVAIASPHIHMATSQGWCNHGNESSGHREVLECCGQC